MTRRLVVAELLKFRTTRTGWALLVALLVLAALGPITTVLTAGDTGVDLRSSDGVREALSSASLGLVCILALAIIGMAGEYRLETVTDTFLSDPGRIRVMLAKFMAYGAVAFGAGLAVALIVAAAALPLLSSEGAGVSLSDREVWLPLLGLVLAATVYGPLGVALGAVIPSQVPALVGALVWALGVEPVLINLLPEVGRWLPLGATSALTNSPTESLLSMFAGGLVLLAYTGVLAVVGIRLTLVRDITS